MTGPDEIRGPAVHLTGGMTIGGSCPKCGGNSITYDDMAIANGVMSRGTIRCEGCGFRQIIGEPVARIAAGMEGRE